MDTLRGVFPTVPTEALLRVLDVCDQSVALASTWLLENDWQDLLIEGRDEDVEEEEEGEDEEIGHSVTPSTFQAAGSMVVSTGVRTRNGDEEDDVATGPFTFQEELDDEEEDEGDEEEDEEEEEDEYYDSGDETGFRMGGVPPLTKRIKVSKSEGRAGDDSFWVSFDGQVMVKSMIELLNTTLSKLAHSKVVLLSQPAPQLDEAEATDRLRSMVSSGEEDTNDREVSGNGRDAATSGEITLSRLLNDINSSQDEIGKVVGPSATTEESVGRKRKRKEVAENSTQQGFFAHFFPVRELDMVWRTVLHAHLFKGRFGEKIEFHTASGGPFSKRDFDELMHIQSSAGSSRVASLGFSPLATLKCCLLLPCSADEEEIFRVGKNIHNLLKVRGNLYYGVGNSSDATTASDGGKMTEERFRQFARYRIKENTSANDSPKPSKVAVDSYMSYQQPRKSSHSLECLEGDKWTCRLG